MASIDAAALDAEINAIVSEVEGLVEVVVALPDGTTLSEINSQEPIESASLYKLAIMVEVFRQREMGELSFNEEIVLVEDYFKEEDSFFGESDIGYAVRIESLLTTMITLSSNVAAKALLARVGNESINLTMASLGLNTTEIRWSPERIPPGSIPQDHESPDDDPAEEAPVDEEPVEESPTDEAPDADTGDSHPLSRSLLQVPSHTALLNPRTDEALNVTSAADLANLFIMLLNGQVVSEAASYEMLALLEGQLINNRLPAYLPEGTIVAHKTGNVDGLVHDAGVIYAPAGPVVVVVLTDGVVEWQAIDLIARIARLAYDVPR